MFPLIAAQLSFPPAALLGAAGDTNPFEFVVLAAFSVYSAIFAVWLGMEVYYRKQELDARAAAKAAERAAEAQQRKRAATAGTPAPAAVAPAAPVASGAPSAAPAAKAAAPAGSEGITPEILAVIAASVVAIAGPRARIQRVQLVSHVPGSPWAEHGRSMIHESHRLRKTQR